MDNNGFNGNVYVDLKHPVSEEVSPYDAEYPISFLANALKAKLEQAQDMAREVYKAAAKEAPMFIQVQQSLKKGGRYVLDITDSTFEAIESGKLKLSTTKGGKIIAQFREANGDYGSNIPIKKELFRKGIDPVQMANALQMKALQEQIQEIANQISIIDHRVREVLQGQQNDRIGLYYSGRALYLESRNITDGGLKKSLMAQSLRTLSESTFQLTLAMQSDIRYLANEEYKSAKGKRVDLIDDHMHSINQSFGFIHQATLLRAGIYCDQGELVAMSRVFEEYSNFIETTVAKNADLLAQCDMTDSGAEEGIWKSRAKFTLNVSDFAKQLNAPDKTIYLGISKEDG